MIKPAPAVWAALCRLDQAADQARTCPVAASDAVMDAVVVLVAASCPEDDLHEFLRIIADPAPHAYSTDSADYYRTTYAHIELHGIARVFGVERFAPGVALAMRADWPSTTEGPSQ